MPQKQSTITKLSVNHYGHNQYRSSYKRPDAQYAYMTLWAKTALDDDVWLHTVHDLTTARIDSKIKQYEQANQHLLGKSITYNFKPAKGIGFCRSLEDELQPVDPWEKERRETT